MNQYVKVEIKEDCILFALNEIAARTPKSEIKRELESYVQNSHKLVEHESDTRYAEIEECYCRYAELLLEHINAGKNLPQYKSYSLNA